MASRPPLPEPPTASLNNSTAANRRLPDAFAFASPPWATPPRTPADASRAADLIGLDPDVDAVDRVIDVFTQARLVTADESSIEFAHEALLHEWPRLRSWLDDDREELRVVARLQTAVADWHNGERSDTDLYRGLRLDTATQLDPRHLSVREQAFLAASMEHRNTERTRQRRAHRRLQRLVASLAIVLAVAVIAAVFAVRQSNQARQQKTLANESATQAQKDATPRPRANGGPRRWPWRHKRRTLRSTIPRSHSPSQRKLRRHRHSVG